MYYGEDVIFLKWNCGRSGMLGEEGKQYNDGGYKIWNYRNIFKIK